MPTLALTELLGAPVMDSSGRVSGRVREVALALQEDRARVSALIVKTRSGDRTLSLLSVSSLNGVVRASSPFQDWPVSQDAEQFLFLARDLLDQQVIDINGRKVVRVNDIDLLEDRFGEHPGLRVGSVDIGARGAIRRLLKGIVPAVILHPLLLRIPPRLIPWDYVDLLERDATRRVKLKISYERLARLHPADIADIVEDLAPDDREAVFETLDDEVAADALGEIEPKVQKAIVESLDSDRAADIVEEMEPDAAADLLGDLSAERSEEILVQMQPEERQEVTDLLEFEESSAAGRMTTEYLSLRFDGTAYDAIEALRRFEGGVESVNTFYLVDSRGTLVGAVPLPNVALASPTTPLLALAQEPLISCHADTEEKKVAELFDKYNLLTLPVIDDHGQLTGVITSDDVISLLRQKL